MRTLRYLFVILLATATVASAADSTQYGKVKVGGLMYAYYYYNMTNTIPTENSFPQEAHEPLGDGFNQFDIERVYVNVTSQLSENTAFRFTTDVYRDANAAKGASAFFNGLSLRVKYGYFAWKPASDLTLIFGQQGTPWFDL
ncbi:MAG TPA: hypothetical protein VFA55_01480, partial [Candidatus Kapabacteria bacterium]|nr:hypothetical protein [Candidatus Kapabacteria bacterium]